MARELGWDNEEVKRQVENFILEFKKEYESPFTAEAQSTQRQHREKKE
jgi:hypothetical protein